ncbi:MAG: tetratricopeptide repeat protein [Coraliomargaritaceae bacterium]
MDSLSDKNWHHWERRRSHKINPINYLYIILLSFLSYFPLLQNNLLWQNYDEVYRSFFPALDSWTSIFSNSIFWNENPIALSTYFIESFIPLPEAFTHRFINILLHSSAAILLFRLLNRMHVSGAFLTSLIFTIHPIVVQTIFWPGYRSTIIALCLTLWCLYLALDRKNKKNHNVAFILTGMIAIIHPIALIIPLILFLHRFVKNKTFKLEDFNKIIPHAAIVLVLSILTEILEKQSMHQLNLTVSQNGEQVPGFIYQLLEYLKIIYFPFGTAFFTPIHDKFTFSSFYLLPFFFLFIIFVFLFYKITTIWARLLIMGFSLLITLLVYASCQNGFFLDGTYALDDALIYITIIPAIALVSSSINALVVHKVPQFKILWYSLVGILIAISTSITFSRSLLYSKPLKMWEYYNMTWSDSVTPKNALSDHFINNGYMKYDIDDHIQLLEFVFKKTPENIEQKITLARLYVKDKQEDNARKLYEIIVNQDEIRDPKILEEAANFFELQGLYWNARKTRDLLDEIVQ